MFEEDLGAFFDDREFAVEATYTPSGGSAKAVLVIFDAASLEQFGIAGTNPVALGKASDFAALAAAGDDALAVGGVSYRIKDAQPQGDGALVLLQLEQQ